MKFNIEKAQKRGADSKGRFERVVKASNIQTMMIEGCNSPRVHSFHIRLSDVDMSTARGIAEGLDISVACLFRLLLAEVAKGVKEVA